jgi:hypothetical protein
MSNETIHWPGKSGKSYTYTIFLVGTEFSPNQLGNYIFCKKTAEAWNAVYIGQGDIKQRTESHISDGCVTKKGATHIHAHNNNDESIRQSEESDLLALHTEAYMPTGCNEKIGG